MSKPEMSAWLEDIANMKPGDPIPEPPPRTAEQEAIDGWGQEHAHLVELQVRAMATGYYDEEFETRRHRIAELRRILGSAGEDDR